jgi:hypothetical protein
MFAPKWDAPARRDCLIREISWCCGSIVLTGEQMPFQFSPFELIFIIGGLIAVPVIGFRLIAPWLDSMRNAEKRGIEPLAEGEQAPVNNAIQHTIASLEELGFTSLGPSRTQVGKVTGYTHHLMSSDGAIHAEVIAYFEVTAVCFTTMLQDESVLETSTPIGEKIRTPELRTDWTRMGLHAAYEVHRENMQSFIASRMSRPWTTTSLADVAEREKRYRARHFRRKLRPGLMRSVWLVLTMTLAVGCAIAAMISTRFIDIDDPFRSPGMWIATVAIAVGVPSLMAMFFFLWRVTHHAGR